MDVYIEMKQTFERGFPFSIITTSRLGATVLAMIAPYTPAAPPPTTTNTFSHYQYLKIKNKINKQPKIFKGKKGF